MNLIQLHVLAHVLVVAEQISDSSILDFQYTDVPRWEIHKNTQKYTKKLEILEILEKARKCLKYSKGPKILEKGSKY